MGLTFKGRFSRGQFWRYWLGALLGLVLLSLIGAGLSQLGLAARIAGRIIWVAGLLGAAWLSAATQVKRWHDLNRSGWMILIIFIPLVGFLAALICLGFLRGTPGANRFGEPLKPGAAAPLPPVGEAPPVIAEPPMMAASGTAPGRSNTVRWLLGVGVGLVALVVLGGVFFSLALPHANWLARRNWVLAHFGSAAECHALAWRYRTGQGLDQDFTKAAYWFERAAAKGLATAQYDLGGMYFYGIGVPADSTHASSLLSSAAAQNYAPAMTLLGLLFAAEDSFSPQAQTWWEQAAAAGDPWAESLLGSAHLRQRGEDEAGQEHLILALYWLETARRHQVETVPGLLQHIWATVSAENLEAVTGQVFGRLENGKPDPVAPEPAMVAATPVAATPEPDLTGLSDEVLAQVRAKPDYVSLSTLYAEKSQTDPAWPASDEGQAVGQYLQAMREDASAVAVNKAEDGTRTLDYTVGGSPVTESTVRFDDLESDQDYRRSVVDALAQNIISAPRPLAVTEFLKKAGEKGGEGK